jgi:hypothetical protein
MKKSTLDLVERLASKMRPNMLFHVSVFEVSRKEVDDDGSNKRRSTVS